MRTDDFDYNLPEELIASRMAFDCQALPNGQEYRSFTVDRLLVDLFQGQCIDADPGNRGYLASHGRYEQQPIRWIAGKSAAQQPRYRGEDLKWPRGVEQQQLIECQHHHRTRRGVRHGSKRWVFGMERHGLPRHTRFHAHRGDRQCSPAAHNTSGT